LFPRFSRLAPRASRLGIRCSDIHWSNWTNTVPQGSLMA
jgi:hypothetical protein